MNDLVKCQYNKLIKNLTRDKQDFMEMIRTFEAMRGRSKSSVFARTIELSQLHVSSAAWVKTCNTIRHSIDPLKQNEVNAVIQVLQHEIDRITEAYNVTEQLLSMVESHQRRQSTDEKQVFSLFRNEVQPKNDDAEKLKAQIVDEITRFISDCDHVVSRLSVIESNNIKVTMEAALVHLKLGQSKYYQQLLNLIGVEKPQTRNELINLIKLFRDSLIKKPFKETA